MKPVADAEALVKRVTQKQNSQGYTDEQMAGFFGCSRETYNLTKNGNMKVGNAYYTGAVRFLSEQNEKSREKRTSVIRRETSETDITLELNIDGTGKYEISTGVGMFDHLLSQLAKHGKFDLSLMATGDDTHHIIEDVAICLGEAFRKALGDMKGIERMANVTLPMDDALVSIAVDISGRGYAVLNTPLGNGDLSGLPADLVRHFLESFAIEARINLHASILNGSNDHHKAEALFKALGRALDKATIIDERISRELPTTKDYIQA